MWLKLSMACAWLAFRLLDASVALYIRSEGGSEKLAKKLGKVAAERASAPAPVQHEHRNGLN